MVGTKQKGTDYDDSGPQEMGACILGSIDFLLHKFRLPIRADEEKARFAWGVRSLPWLILTYRKHKVLAEGLGLDQIESEIQEAEAVNR